MAVNEKELKKKVSDLGILLSAEQKEVKRLKGIGAELEQQKEATVKANEEISRLKISNEKIGKDNQQLKKDIEKYAGENTDDLKADLKKKNDQLEESVKLVSTLKIELKGLFVKNQKLMEGGEKDSAVGEELKDQKKLVEKLTNENASLQMKLSKTQGDFPKPPSQSTLLSEIHMDSDEKMQVYSINPKNGDIPLLAQVHVKSGKCIDVQVSAVVK